MFNIIFKNTLIAIVFSFSFSFFALAGGEGGGGGGSSSGGGGKVVIGKGVFSRSIGGDGDGGGGPKLIKVESSIAGKDFDSVANVIISTLDNDYLLSASSTEEVESFIDERISNEEVLSITILE